eukprot:11027-Pleurochrysis_carterae.AAC.1
MMCSRPRPPFVRLERIVKMGNAFVLADSVSPKRALYSCHFVHVRPVSSLVRTTCHVMQAQAKAAVEEARAK